MGVYHGLFPSGLLSSDCKLQCYCTKYKCQCVACVHAFFSVCVCVCVHVHTRACVYVCVHACVCVLEKEVVFLI